MCAGGPCGAIKKKEYLGGIFRMMHFRPLKNAELH
jgi:hypothetical protein